METELQNGDTIVVIILVLASLQMHYLLFVLKQNTSSHDFVDHLVVYKVSNVYLNN